MRTFAEWAEHYGYEDTPEARADYGRYQDELLILLRTLPPNYGECFSELLDLMKRCIDNNPEIVIPTGFDATRWLAKWVEKKNERLGGDRPTDLFMSQDGFAEVEHRLREAVWSLDNSIG